MRGTLFYRGDKEVRAFDTVVGDYREDDERGFQDHREEYHRAVALKMKDGRAKKAGNGTSIPRHCVTHSNNR